MAVCTVAPAVWVSRSGVLAIGIDSDKPAEETVTTSAAPSTEVESITTNAPAALNTGPLATVIAVAPCVLGVSAGGPARRARCSRAVVEPRQRVGQHPGADQVARAVNPVARVAYVDIDPMVLSHVRTLLATSDGVTAVAGDLRDPAGGPGRPGASGCHRPAKPAGSSSLRSCTSSTPTLPAR